MNQTIKENRSQSKMGSKNPMWKGDNATDDCARHRARVRYPHPKGYEIHHKDGDPYNNEPENIMIVSRREHMMLDGRLEQFRKNQVTASSNGRAHRWKTTNIWCETQVQILKAYYGVIPTIELSYLIEHTPKQIINKIYRHEEDKAQ